MFVCTTHSSQLFVSSAAVSTNALNVDLVNDIALSTQLLNLFSSPATMSVTQNFDSYSSGNTAAGGGAPNADFDLKDAQLDEASAGAEGQSGILSGGIGQVAQNATQIVSLCLCNYSNDIFRGIFF